MRGLPVRRPPFRSDGDLDGHAVFDPNSHLDTHPHLDEDPNSYLHLDGHLHGDCNFYYYANPATY